MRLSAFADIRVKQQAVLVLCPRRWTIALQKPCTSSAGELRKRSIEKASAEDWILITDDKDFGEKVYREKRPHRGVIFLRLSDERAANKILVLKRLLAQYADQIADRFVVVTDERVRFAVAVR